MVVARIACIVFHPTKIKTNEIFIKCSKSEYHRSTSGEGLP